MTDFGALREAMVEQQIAGRGLRDAPLLAAMREVPREAFVPAAVREFAQHAWGLQTTEASYVLLRPNKDAMLDKHDPWQ